MLIRVDAPVRAGEVLAQKYRVDRVLGVGGMGVVVAATHLQLDQKVALKFMLKEAFADADALARFQREARAAVRLRSEHVARVSDTGTFDNGSPYIVMEYLEGTDLSQELARSGPLSPQVVSEYIVQACDALAEAHSLGIIHRDLKPANLFLTRRTDGSPLVKVLDFGISKANSLTDSGLAMTKTSAMLGSPLYMSPEQVRSSKDVDARSDVWSLGIIMYELLGGRVPFMSDTLGGLLSIVMMDAPTPLQVVRPDLPPALCALVARCLEKQTDQRSQNVAEIARALAPFCPSRSLPIVDRVSAVIGASLPVQQRTQAFASAPAIRTSQPAQTGAPPNSSPFAISGPGAVTGPGNTANGWGSTQGAPVPPASRSKTPLIALLVLGVAGVAGLVLAFAIHRTRADSLASHAIASASAGSLASGPPPKPESAAPTPLASTSAASSASALPSATAAVAVAPDVARPPKPGGALPAAKAQAQPSPPSKAPAVAVPSVTTSTSGAAAPPTATTHKPGIMETSQ